MILRNLEARYRRWLEALEAHRLDGFLVTHPPNLRYLFNFTGSTGLACFLGAETHLIVDSRYREQAAAETVNCQSMLAEKSLEDTLKTTLSNSSHVKGGHARIGLEAHHVSYDCLLRLQSWTLPVEWVPTRELIEELRVIKDEEEIELLEKAFQMAHKAYQQAVKQVRSGMTEGELAGILEFELRKAGGQGLAFETIVASGPRSSLPHGSSTAREIESDEFVLMDFGLRYQGYCSDLTRIHLLSDAQRPAIYQVVQEAQEAALALIEPGVLSSEIDAAARGVISQHGFEDYFGHSTGHGLGLEVHELPRVSTLRPGEIQQGMAFTIEPGIYLPGQYGVRIEDAVVVTRNGYQLLSNRDV